MGEMLPTSIREPSPSGFSFLRPLNGAGLLLGFGEEHGVDPEEIASRQWS
jgi:hypothetical protein